jgi:hypothetical protein
MVRQIHGEIRVSENQLQIQYPVDETLDWLRHLEMAQQNGGTTSKIIKYEGNMTVRLLSS